MMNFGAIKNKDTNVMMENSNDIFKILNKDILYSIQMLDIIYIGKKLM